MIAVDTSVIYALLDRQDEWHARTSEWYLAYRPELATTPLVLAEVDHLALARAGQRAARAWRRDVAEGAYAVEWWPGAAESSVGVAERYADLGMSLTDASLVVLAERIGTNEIATLDERHFRAVEPEGGHDHFRLLPMDV